MVDLSMLSHAWLWSWLIVCLIVLLVGVYADNLTVSILPITAITIYLSFQGFIAGWIWIVTCLIVAIGFAIIVTKSFLGQNNGGGGQNINM